MTSMPFGSLFGLKLPPFVLFRPNSVSSTLLDSFPSLDANDNCQIVNMIEPQDHNADCGVVARLY